MQQRFADVAVGVVGGVDSERGGRAVDEVLGARDHCQRKTKNRVAHVPGRGEELGAGLSNFLGDLEGREALGVGDWHGNGDAFSCERACVLCHGCEVELLNEPLRISEIMAGVVLLSNYMALSIREKFARMIFSGSDCAEGGGAHTPSKFARMICSASGCAEGGVKLGRGHCL